MVERLEQKLQLKSLSHKMWYIETLHEVQNSGNDIKFMTDLIRTDSEKSLWSDLAYKSVEITFLTALWNLLYIQAGLLRMKLSIRMLVGG